MAKGKQTCKILKEIRKQIAEDNDIELIIEECTYKGDCLGTCPKCEAEVRYLERELEKRQRLGKVAVLAGMSLGTLFAATSCDSAQPMSNTPCGTEKPGSEEPLAGDVLAVAPEKQEPDSVVIIRENDLMGIVPMFRMVYEFKADQYQKLMKDKFVFPEMNNLSVIGGSIEYEKIARGEVHDTFEKLVEAAVEFKAPYYPDGEQKMLEDLAAELKVDAGKYKGNMEVEFTVTPWGEISNVEIVKGIDKVLDEAVVEALGQMRWRPAECQLKDEYDPRSFECRCMQKILFPIE